MNRLKRKEADRPRAFWGALISAGVGIASALLNSKAQEKQRRLQANLEDYNNSLKEAQGMTNALNAGQDYQQNYLQQFKQQARLGTTRRLGGRNIMITDGGNAKRIGNNTYLLRGGSHEDINETGQTGIGINVGGNEIEAEGGEVAQRKGNSLRIYSAQPILGGISPAQAIMRGYNKDKVFNAQQRFKKNNGIKDDGSKAAFGNLITMPFAGIVKDVVDYFSNSGKYAPKRVKVSNKTVNRKPIRNSQVGNFRVVNGKYFPNEKPLRQVYPEFDIISMGRGLPIKRSLKNTVGFVQKPNTFTRGIGNREGIKDLVESKVVRGNPVGTEMTAKAYTKATKSNRNSFNDIMNSTGREGISHRYYNRSLSKEDFDAIRESYNKINASFKARNPKASGKIRFAIGDDVYDPLGNYKNYDDYLAQIANDRKTLRNATTINPDNGEPIAYFYDDGRNPLTQGHGYASSKWGVRISNPQDYNMKIFDGHLHYSNSKTIPFDSPNVEVFRSTPFGTIRYPKWMLRRGWYRNGGLTSKDRGSSKHPYPSVASKDFAGGNRSYPIPTKADAVDALRLAGLHGRSDVRSKVYSKYPSLRPKAAFGDWVRTNRNNNALASLLYESGLFDRESWKTALRDIHTFTGMGGDPYNTDENVDAVMAPAFGSSSTRVLSQLAKSPEASYTLKQVLGLPTKEMVRKRIAGDIAKRIGVARAARQSNNFRNYNIARMQAANAEASFSPFANQVRYAEGKPILVNTNGYYTTAGNTISRNAKNMTSGANPFLYAPRTSDEVLEGLSRVISNTKQGAKSVGQKVGNKLTSSSTYRNPTFAERVRDANGKLIWKQNYKYKPWVKATAGAAGTAGVIGLGVGLSNTKSEDENIKTQLDAKGKPISPYIARPQVSVKPQVKKSVPARKDTIATKPATRQVPASIARKDTTRTDTTRTDTTKQVNKVVKRQVRTTPQYTGNTTKGNYQLHDGETKVINGIKYTRRGNTIINHKTNVGYIYDKNGNYTGQADYSKVGNFNQAFDAARAAGRSQFIYRAGKYNNYSTVKETNANKEALNRRIGARRIAKRMGCLTNPPVERFKCGGRIRPKAEDGMLAPIYSYGSDRRRFPSFAPIDVTPRAIPNFKPISVPTNTKTPFDPNSVPFLGKQSSFKPTTQDYIGLGIDTLASLGIGLINSSAASKTYLPERPAIIQASKLPTYYNVAPQVEEVKRQRDILNEEIANNTSSSVAALNRISRIRGAATGEINKLYATKENEENKMLTQDALNQQQVAAENAKLQADYENNKANILNAASQAKANALSGTLSGLSQAWTNFASTVENRYDSRQNEIAAISSSNSPSVVKNAISLGYNLSPEVLANLYKNSKNEELRNTILGRLSPNERKRYGIK